VKNIKLGLAGWGFRQMTLREYFDAASRLGLPLVELNCRADIPNHAWVDFDKQDITEVMDCATDLGIKIVALSANNDFTPSDPAQLNSQAAQLRRVIELAHEFGARFVRVIVGPASEISPSVRETAVRKLQEASQFAEGFGVILALENGLGSLLSSADCLGLMQELSADPIGLLYNPANFARYQDNPVAALELLSEYVCYSHLADWDGQRVCAVGTGGIDWPKVLNLLDKSDAHLALIEYPHPEDVELGIAAGQKALSSFLRKIGGREL